MLCSASLFLSINSLKPPHREYSGGISVRLIQPPSAYMKKSSCGLMDVSMFFGSSGGGFFSICGCGSARKLNALKSATRIKTNDFMILEENKCSGLSNPG